MASAPVFASTPVVWSGLTPATADTSRTAPTNVTTLGSAGSSGTRIEEIVFQGVGTTVLGVVRVFAYDGSTYHLIDEMLISAYTAAETTLAPRYSRTYSNLVLPSGWSLRCTCSNSGNQSMVKVSAFGASI